MVSVVWGILESVKLSYQGEFLGRYVGKKPHFRNRDCTVYVNQFSLPSVMQICATLLTDITARYREQSTQPQQEGQTG